MEPRLSNLTPLSSELVPDILNVLDRMERMLQSSAADADIDYTDFIVGLRQRVIRAHPSNQVYTAASLRAILDRAPAGIIIIDHAGRIERFNAAAESIFGYTAGELIGRNIAMLMPPDVAAKHAASVARYLETPPSQRRREMPRQVLARRKNGEQFPLEVELGPIESGGEARLMGVVRDASERQQALAALQAECELAQAATAAKTRLLAFASHEIRTPITAILGFAEMLLESELGETERRHAVQTIRHSGKHLLELVNDILDLSRIEAGVLRVERIACSPATIISSVDSLMQALARRKGLNLAVRYEGPIPTSIQTDPTRLRQILLNVVGNALKFTGHGGVTLTVGLADPIEAQRPRLRMTVSDTGAGMAPEEITALFGEFSQANPTIARRFGGTGLGLSISRRLARLLGGDISVSSRMGSGTTVVVTVKTGSLADVRMADCPTPMAVAPAEDGFGASSPWRHALRDRRILLAEDNEDNLALLSYVLTRGGAQISLARNGMQAVEAVLDEPSAGTGGPGGFDVILLDMRMPIMDGYEAARTLRERGYRGPIVALTADTMCGDRDECIAAGCDDYVSKPIDRRQLVTTIDRLLRGRRPAAAAAAAGATAT